MYEGREDVTLTTYVITDSPELLNGRMRPAIIICPGGAYLSCSDREGEPLALRFAAMGYHTFVLRYSTYGNGQSNFDFTDPHREVNLNSIEPAPTRDLGKAMLIVREYTDEWLVDVGKIAACGFSAGAHNCAMYSVYWHTPVLSDFFGTAPEMFKPAAAILGYTLSNYILMRQRAKNDFETALFRMSNLAFTGHEEPEEEPLIRISPALNVTSNTPPMFLWATSSDNLVPVEQTARLATALAHNGIPFEVHIFEQGPHGLSLADQSTASVKSYIMPDVAKWVELAETWLQKRFAFEMPEKSMRGH